MVQLKIFNFLKKMQNPKNRQNDGAGDPGGCENARRMQHPPLERARRGASSELIKTGGSSKSFRAVGGLNPNWPDPEKL